MPPRFSRHDLRCVILLLSCVLSALQPAPAQTPPSARPAPAHAAAAAAATPAKPATAKSPAAPAKPAAGPVAAKPPAASQPATPKAAAPAKPGTAPTKPAAPATTATSAAASARPAAIPAPTTGSSPAASPKPSAVPPSAGAPVAAGSPGTVAAIQKTLREKISPFVKTYCYECHGDRKMKGGVTFHFALKDPGDPASARRWKTGLTTVSAHDMPPDDADKQPTDAERETFMQWVRDLKYLNRKDPGAFIIRRLTKTEYGNTLHDLLGVPADIVKELPDEVPGEGYLNTLSPLQMEQYLGIANEALRSAGAPRASQNSAGVPLAPASGAPIMLALTSAPAPAKGAPPAEVRAAARGVAQKIARSAYRRPPTDAETEVLLSVFDLAKKNKLSYDDALRLMLKAALVSPQFLYITPAGAAPAGSEIVPLDDWMLASRLSYLLWATLPDEELSTLADQGKLHEPAVLSAQVARLLKDDRARALFDGFGAQWLGVADLADKTFDTTLFPQMTPELRQAMYDEVRLFFTGLIRDNAAVSTFITADHTYLSAPLAAIYGVEQNRSSSGAELAPRSGKTAAAAAGFTRVKLTDPNRGGILGMPGILAATSFPNRTSPVKRGVWVLEQILGEHIPPPPPNVPTLEKQDKKKTAGLTLRQRTELHRTNVVCANCHKILDPIGFGLENFDAIGRWRAQDDSGGPIDAAGELPGGKRFTTPAELKAIIAARKDDLARNLTEKLLAYALCRQLEGYDEIVIDQLMKSIAPESYRLQPLITAVVTSYPFMNRRVVEVVGSSGYGAPVTARKTTAAPGPATSAGKGNSDVKK